VQHDVHFAHAAKVPADGQIAAIAYVNDPVLVTGNVKISRASRD